jgi:ketosteroid isomerase-like protein
MKSIIQAIIIVVFVFLSCLPTLAQTSNGASENSLVLEQGVAPHKGLDEVYRRFTEGYKKLDAPSVVGLYSETAAYLAPGSTVKIGRQKVSEIFTGFFDSVKQQKGRLEISFRILQRQVDKNLAYDVGIYTLTSFNQKGASSKDSGKFVVVARRDKGSVWRFQVDGYSALTNER